MIQAPLFLSLPPPQLGLICWWKLDAGDALHAGPGDAVNQKPSRFGSDRLCDEPDTHSGLGQDLWTQGRRFHRQVGRGGYTGCCLRLWTWRFSWQFYYHLVSTNPARNTGWCKPRQSAERGYLSLCSHLPDSCYPAPSALKGSQEHKTRMCLILAGIQVLWELKVSPHPPPPAPLS